MMMETRRSVRSTVSLVSRRRRRLLLGELGGARWGGRRLGWTGRVGVRVGSFCFFILCSVGSVRLDALSFVFLSFAGCSS